MAKIYEALKQAQRERMEEETPFTVPAPGDPRKTPPDSGMHQEMALLYQQIDSLLHGSTKKVIQFIAAREGEGTSTIVREFARTSATILGKSVFLFNAELPNALLAPAAAGGGGDDGGGQDPCNQEASEANVSRVEPATTAVCLIPQDFTNIRKYFYSPQIDSFWDSLRQQFDLILIDSPPFETSPDGIAISRRVDGVVLVLEAEKTRWPVAEHLKEQILLSGGNILGIVFNKRRYYIPEFIYKQI
jgi:Mrp family chromosome partitioning ATPase